MNKNQYLDDFQRNWLIQKWLLKAYVHDRADKNLWSDCYSSQHCTIIFFFQTEHILNLITCMWCFAIVASEYSLVKLIGSFVLPFRQPSLVLSLYHLRKGNLYDFAMYMNLIIAPSRMEKTTFKLNNCKIFALPFRRWL